MEPTSQTVASSEAPSVGTPPWVLGIGGPVLVGLLLWASMIYARMKSGRDWLDEHELAACVFDGATAWASVLIVLWLFGVVSAEVVPANALVIFIATARFLVSLAKEHYERFSRAKKPKE